jgi:transcription initiation factor IIE alpha subunit
MISFEERLMESDLRRSNCYYIDYQHFVHVVRYRIHVMQSEIRNSENVELNRHFLVCPTCKTKYSELEYYKVRDKNNKFICQHCCPLQSFRTIESEKYYQLVEYDRTAKMNEVQALGAKYKRQFGRSEGHEGIYELLAQLRDVSVTRNLPSENIVRGNVASRVVDAEVQSQIDYNNVGVKVRCLNVLRVYNCMLF